MTSSGKKIHDLSNIYRFLVTVVFWWRATLVCCLQSHCQKFFDGTGVTSLHSLNAATLFAGTKAGKIYVKSTNLLSVGGIDTWNELVGHESKYPIYSLSSSSTASCDNESPEERRLLFGGGGDRMISVWECSLPDQPYDFHCIQKLGPHTGWVKDLVFDDRRALLHSIGCNRIESWDCSVVPIRHVSTRSIESSPAVGCTLSSDLLCLCIIPDDGLLVSGGVDGRIQLWPSDPVSFKQQFYCSVGCHEGRVNSLVFSALMRALFSVGNDGSIHAYHASAAKGLQLRTKLDVYNGGRKFRLTSAVIVAEFRTEDNSFVCELAIGSSGGEVVFVNAEMDVNHRQLILRIDGSAEVVEGSLIYALFAQRVGTTTRLYIAHATGLAALDIPHV